MRPSLLSLARALALLTAVLASTAIGCGSTTAPPPTGGIRVLFIGNSLTYLNDLPWTLSRLALAANDTIHAEMVAVGNFALIDHYLGGSTALAAIREKRWDYVVLQQGPSSVPINRDSLIISTQLFDAEIKRAGARTALYMVWPSRDRISFFDAVRESYQAAADTVDGIFMPAGRAWQTAWATDPNLVLYHQDGLHSSALGTYLAALVIYERLTGHDARSLSGTAMVEGNTLNVPEATVRLLQRAAHETNALYPP